ncbi:hypothetical protein OG458_42635 (plasmid) [Streptomyces sp. NBC_01281]|uniref:hypothetical protein n=1 Tax=Streptomyces sp. NBC_01281 TaxID=2903811 RepID=UPI002E16809D|nr:hypothetical protein OG458_42635 [Streptomyces sp. NBC_01281]
MVDMWDLDSGAIEERVALQAQVRDLVWRETKRRLGFGEHEGPTTPNALAPTSAAALHLHLMYLKVATEAGEAGQNLAADAAVRAGRAGATYADLGQATNMSRQGARKRWPGTVGTQWVLQLLTGKGQPHGMATQVFRNSEKAIQAGRTAVDQGALSDDGAVAAVVIDSARQVMWACHANRDTWALEETALPEKLQTVPQAGEPGHGDWAHQWDQYISRLR